ncbi:MAG TPA: serine/threonine-protein kinase [Kofleriaceae bacterium]|nr:serine/threonine-protein kinase [Kofleriaceae bacterium]
MPPGLRLGRYELIRRLASGGMAELYLARAAGIEGFEKIVALKRILPQYAHNDDFVRMFLDEARLTATIHHANVAQVYDIGQSEDGYFFAMEYVHGADLRTMLQTLFGRDERMPMAHALTIAIGAAAGLHAAHERCAPDGTPLGIIHRDVTPSNVLVSFEGCVKLIDFGIAKAERRTTETRAGTLKGKIAYMSPEQCLGETLDRRSDVFSLGIVLYEATTGTRLFPGDNEYAALRQIVDKDAPPPSTRRSDYLPELETIVMRALRRDREHRYPTAQALQLDLEELARRKGLAISNAHLARYVRGLLPDRAREQVSGETALASPPPPPPARTAVAVARGSSRVPALPLAPTQVADEPEPSISIEPAGGEEAAAPEPGVVLGEGSVVLKTGSGLNVASPATGTSVSAVELALFVRQRKWHLAMAVGAAAVVSAVIAVVVVLMAVGGGRAAPAPAAVPAPAPAPAPVAAPVPAPVPVADPVPVPEPAPAAVAVDVPEPIPAAATPAPRAKAPRRKPAEPAPTKAAEPPRKPTPSKPAAPRAWNPDSALPPM